MGVNSGTVWGCMSASSMGKFQVCDGCMNSYHYLTMLEEALESSVLKLFNEDVPDFIFHPDNTSLYIT